MHEELVRKGQNTIFCRHNGIKKGDSSILLIHGLGESGLSFSEIFEDDRFDSFNVVAPDLVGYGKSSWSVSKNYSFAYHLDCLWEVIDHFMLDDITVVGHSLGGDLGTLLCRQDMCEYQGPERDDCVGRIRRFINVEGNLTKHDLFISRRAHAADERGGFNKWFQERFLYGRVYRKWCGWGKKKGSFARRYLASLHFCDPEAFRQNAVEIYRRNHVQGSDSGGILYSALEIREKLYVYGAASLGRQGRRFLKKWNLKSEGVEDSYHWPMIDQPEAFYEILHAKCRADST